MNDIKIEDNFLSFREFEKIQDLFKPNKGWSGPISWSLGPIDNRTTDDYQLTHMHYHAPSGLTGINTIDSRENQRLLPMFLVKIQPRALVRIKSNLIMRTHEIIKHHFHQDFADYYDGLTTSIYYINSNDGYTEFKDGTIIESIANRLVTFPTNLKHTGTTCTNNPFRVVINFNYF